MLEKRTSGGGACAGGVCYLLAAKVAAEAWVEAGWGRGSCCAGLRFFALGFGLMQKSAIMHEQQRQQAAAVAGVSTRHFF